MSAAASRASCPIIIKVPVHGNKPRGAAPPRLGDSALSPPSKPELEVLRACLLRLDVLGERLPLTR